VHNAHLAVAGAAYEQADLAQVIFIPAAQSPLKGHAPATLANDRVEMLRLAIENRPEFSLDLSEIEAGGVSYTIDTVLRMHARYPDVELFWIIGADQLAQLDRWARIDELVKLVRFLVLKRSGSSVAAEVPGLSFQWIEAPLMSESSTEIRRRIAEGDPVDDLVPTEVAAFIDRRGLYRHQ